MQKPDPLEERAEHEIHHGNFLSGHNPERTWGWGSPAGAVRALEGDISADLLVSGFGEEDIRAFDWLHPVTPRSLIRAVSAAGEVVEKIPLAREFAGSLYIRAVKPLP